MNMDHVSPSALGMATRCMVQYYFAYVQKIKMPPGVAMLKGSSVHDGRRANLKQKIGTGQDLAVADVQDATRDSMVARFSGDVQFDPEDKAGTPKRQMADSIDAVTHVAARDYEVYQVPTVPKVVEQGLKATIPGYDTVLLGYVDLIDQADVLRDLKTVWSGRSPAISAADNSLQLTAYDLLARANGLSVSGLQLEYLIPQKKGIKTMELSTTRTRGQHEALLRRLAVLLEAVRREVFVPAEVDSWMCSPRFCGYADQCPYYHGQKRPKS